MWPGTGDPAGESSNPHLSATRWLGRLAGAVLTDPVPDLGVLTRVQPDPRGAMMSVPSTTRNWYSVGFAVEALIHPDAWARSGQVRSPNRANVAAGAPGVATPAYGARVSTTDLPRERLRSHGPHALSDAEVLALILGTGGPEGVTNLARRVLEAVGGPAGLARADATRLSEVRGIGPAKAAEVVAALELGRRASRALAVERPQILTPDDAAALLGPRLAHLDHEESVALLLDRKHRVVSEETVGRGGIAHAPMEAREVYKAAMRQPGVAAVLVAHNHPSGDPTPSPQDVAVTRRLARAGEVLGIEFVDHLIVGSAGFQSLAMHLT